MVVGAGGFSGSGNNSPFAAIDLVAHIPFLPHTFFDADLPIGYGAVGNPMVGVHHVFRPADRLWISFGGALGAPVINSQGFEHFAFANALWDAERFLRKTVPFAVRFGIEGHVGIAELRAELDPVWGISFDNTVDNFAGFQHAVEVQLGHEIGGGLRYQGVLVGTNNPELVATGSPDSLGNPGNDHYQGVLEPFFRLYHDPVFFRTGIVLPLDNPLGAPFLHGWGVRATTGFNLD